jgi:hypothetical protein
VVLLNHFDNHDRPARGVMADLGAEAQAQVKAIPGEITACAPATKVIIPEHFQPIRVP